MTNAKSDSTPCLPECSRLRRQGGDWDFHAPACPNAPKPPEAPKAEELCATCQKQESFHHGSMHGFRKPAPAPEPQGSVCPGCGHRVHGAVCMNFGSDNECPCMAGAKRGSEERYEYSGQEIAALRGEVEALRAAVRDGVVLLQAAHCYVLDADAQFFAFEIEQYIRAQKEHDHE